MSAPSPVDLFVGGVSAAFSAVRPFAEEAGAAIQRLKSSLEAQFSEAQRATQAPLPPRVVVLPRHAPMAAIIPGDTIAEAVITDGVSSFLSLYNTALIVRLVLTWFPNPPGAIVGPLATVCDPYLNLFRGIIPPIGGTLDLSPILAFVVLNLFTSTAAALPAEIPRSAVAAPPAPVGAFSHLTRSEQAFQRRVAAQRGAPPPNAEST